MKNRAGSKSEGLGQTKIKLFFSNQDSGFVKLFLIVLALSLASQISAQVLPESAEPKLRPLQERPKPPAEELPDITVQPPDATAPSGASDIFVVLRNVNIDGATVYSPDTLEETYAHFIGKEISLAEVFSIADRIQEQYRSSGYMLTRVIVPPQSVKDGIFQVHVVEGFISGIKIEGDIGPVGEQLEAYFENIVDQHPVREQDLERYLLLANDLPGVSALGFLRSSVGEPGASELVVQTERKPFGGYTYINNRGSRYTGHERFLLSVRENSATSLGEQIEGTFLHTLTTNEQVYGNLSYRQPLNDEGLQLHLAAGYGPSEPGFTLKDQDVETGALTVNASLNYPIIRSRKHNLYIEAGFQLIDQDVDFRGDPISRDRLRVVFANIAYDFKDALGGQSLFSFGLRKGLEAFGSSEKNDGALSRADGVPDFTSLNLQISRNQYLWGPFNLYIAGTGQYAFNALLNAEEFKAGGEQFGRGYNPAEITGDDGIGAMAELQYTTPIPFPYWQSLQGYGFYDAGVIWNKGDNSNRRRSLTSAGFGVHNRVLEHFFVDLEIAWPLTSTPDTFNDQDPRLFFQVMARF